MLLLHVYVGDIRPDFVIDNERIYNFSLIIKRKDTSLMFRMISISYISNTIIRFHQTCHIPIDYITTGEISFELNMNYKNGDIIIIGIANCLTSVVENHAMKILQIINTDQRCIAKLSVTLAYQRTVKSMDEEDKNLKYILQNRILSQREYNFLLSRRFHWPGDRPSSWNKEYEEYLNLDPGLVLKDTLTSVINPTHRICRDKHIYTSYPHIKLNEDFISKNFNKKLRKTNMGVGYLGVSWPDNNLYGKQMFDLMRSVTDLKREQQATLRKSLREMRSAIHQNALTELQLNKDLLRRKERLRRSAQEIERLSRQAIVAKNDPNINQLRMQARSQDAIGKDKSVSTKRKTRSVEPPLVIPSRRWQVYDPYRSSYGDIEISMPTVPAASKTFPTRMKRPQSSIMRRADSPGMRPSRSVEIPRRITVPQRSIKSRLRNKASVSDSRVELVNPTLDVIRHVTREFIATSPLRRTRQQLKSTPIPAQSYKPSINFRGGVRRSDFVGTRIIAKKKQRKSVPSINIQTSNQKLKNSAQSIDRAHFTNEVKTAIRAAKRKKAVMKTRISRKRAEESGTGSTTRLVKELDSFIQSEKDKTKTKLQELSMDRGQIEEHDRNKRVKSKNAITNTAKNTATTKPTQSHSFPVFDYLRTKSHSMSPKANNHQISSGNTDFPRSGKVFRSHQSEDSIAVSLKSESSISPVSMSSVSELYSNIGSLVASILPIKNLDAVKKSEGSLVGADNNSGSSRNSKKLGSPTVKSEESLQSKSTINNKHSNQSRKTVEVKGVAEDSFIDIPHVSERNRTSIGKVLSKEDGSSLLSVHRRNSTTSPGHSANDGKLPHRFDNKSSLVRSTSSILRSNHGGASGEVIKSSFSDRSTSPSHRKMKGVSIVQSLSREDDSSISGMIVPLFRRKDGALAIVTEGYGQSRDSHDFSEPFSSTANSFLKSAEDIDTQTANFQVRVAKFIAKASEKKYRYIGKEERPPSHFGKVKDWKKYAPLQATLDRQARDVSSVDTEIVSSEESNDNE